MAFPLIFADEHGKVHRYPWRDYPQRVLQVEPGALEAEWTPRGIMGPPTTVPFIEVPIFCGPPAPLPKPPTADEFRDGLARWMADTEWSWLSH